MPEVSEVALTAEILNKKLRGKTITSFKFSKQFKKKNFGGYKSFTKALPLEINKVDSKGKFLWFELEDEWSIWNEMRTDGMWSFEELEDEDPKLTIELDDDLGVYFYDKRNFAVFKFTSDEKDLKNKLRSLAPDALKTSNINLDKIVNYRGELAHLLTDQKKLVSGIGNYLMAEILYKAKLSPHRKGSDLNRKEIKRLRNAIKKVVKLSYVKNYSGYMINLRSETKKMKRKSYHPDVEIPDTEFEFKVYRQKVDPKGNKVKADKRGNRTTYWVPAIQS